MQETIQDVAEVLNVPTDEVVEEVRELVEIEEEKRQLESKHDKKIETILRRLKKLEDDILDIRRILLKG